MASKAEQRQHERREKKRLKDQARRQEARVRRRALLGQEGLPPDTLPLAECFASESWHEPGALVWAAVSRLLPDGRVSGALFHIDLSAGTLRSLRLLSPRTPSQLEGELGRTAGDQVAMLVCEPPLVAALVAAVLPGFAADPRPALRFLHGIDPADCPHEILVGPPPSATPSASRADSPPAPGLLARLQGWLRRPS